MSKTTPLRWLQKELERAGYKGFDLSKGVDLDRDGQIGETERTGALRSNTVSDEEWTRFFEANKEKLKKLTPFLRTYYAAGFKFKPNNPIHDILEIESEVVNPNAIRTAYEKLDKVRKKVEQGRISGGLSPASEIGNVYVAMKAVGIRVAKGQDRFFAEGMGQAKLGKFTHVIPALAIGYEDGWPVHMSVAPDRAILSWDLKTPRVFTEDGFEWDPFSKSGGVTSAYELMTDLKIEHAAIMLGLYLHNFDRNELISHFLGDRGLWYLFGAPKHPKLYEASQDFSEAVEYNPGNSAAWRYAHGSAEVGVPKKGKPIVRELVRSDFFVKVARDLVTIKNYVGAVKTLLLAKELYPSSTATFYCELAAIFAELGGYEKAKLFLSQVIDRKVEDKDDVQIPRIRAFDIRAKIFFNVGNFEAARADLDQALILDPDNRDRIRVRNKIRSMKSELTAGEDYYALLQQIGEKDFTGAMWSPRKPKREPSLVELPNEPEKPAEVAPPPAPAKTESSLPPHVLSFRLAGMAPKADFTRTSAELALGVAAGDRYCHSWFQIQPAFEVRGSSDLAAHRLGAMIGAEMSSTPGWGSSFLLGLGAGYSVGFGHEKTLLSDWSKNAFLEARLGYERWLGYFGLGVFVAAQHEMFNPSFNPSEFNLKAGISFIPY